MDKIKYDKIDKVFDVHNLHGQYIVSIDVDMETLERLEELGAIKILIKNGWIKKFNTRRIKC